MNTPDYMQGIHNRFGELSLQKKELEESLAKITFEVETLQKMIDLEAQSRSKPKQAKVNGSPLRGSMKKLIFEQLKKGSHKAWTVREVTELIYGSYTEKTLNFDKLLIAVGNTLNRMKDQLIVTREGVVNLYQFKQETLR